MLKCDLGGDAFAGLDRDVQGRQIDRFPSEFLRQASHEFILAQTSLAPEEFEHRLG